MTPGMPQSQVPSTMTIECLVCHQACELRQPTAEVVNTRTVVGLLFARTVAPLCPHCKTPYMFMVQGIDDTGRIIIIWAPLIKKDGLVSSATDNDVKTAAANKNRVEELMKNLKGTPQ